MFHMDIWITLVCGSIAWGALWSAAQLTRRAVLQNAGAKNGRRK